MLMFGVEEYYQMKRNAEIVYSIVLRLVLLLIKASMRGNY